MRQGSQRRHGTPSCRSKAGVLDAAELYSKSTAATGHVMAVRAAWEVEGWAGTLERKQEHGEVDV